MQHALYVGPKARYTGMTAIVQQTNLHDGEGHRLLKVQFDDLAHPMSHGWFTFPSNHWHLLD